MSCAAFGAEDPDPDFSLEETVQAGPLHLAPFFFLKDLGYDSNVRLDAEERTGDFTLTLAPGARAVVPMGRLASLALREEINYSMFARESDLNHVNNNLRGKLHLYLRDVTVFLEGQQDSVRDRPSTEVDFRIRTTTTTGRAGLTWRSGTRAQLDLYVRRGGFRYDPGQPEVLDDPDPNFDVKAIGELISDRLRREETTFAAEGRLRIRPRTTLLLDLRGSRIDFDRQEEDPGARIQQRDSGSATVMAGLDFEPTGTLRGYFKAGVRHLAPDDEKIDGFSGLVADAKLSARLFGRGDVRMTYERDAGFSYLGDNLFHVSQRRGLAYEHYVNGRFSLEIGRSLQRVDLPEPVENPDHLDPITGAPIPERRVDDIVWDQLTLRYRMGPSLRIGLAVGRWERDSTFDLEDASRNTITTLVEYTP